MTGQLRPGEVLGDFEIDSVAGAGGMGVVYRATQRSLGRVVALKVIRSEIASAPEYRERFLREARLAAAVAHPNVVTVYDVGDEDGRLYLVMQWVDGHDLKRLLERCGRLAPERAVAIASQIAGALDAVHGVSGLVHRDVKPANVLLGEVAGRDHAYLTDFGVARPSQPTEQLTQTGWVVGTTGYLSPEQIKGSEPGPRSDLYALGCVFFEALTGQPPFTGENEMAVRWAHAHDPRPTASRVLPALGGGYDHVIATALAVDPEQRFGSGRELAEALTAAHSGAEETAATVSFRPAHAPTAVGPPMPMRASARTPQPPSYVAYPYPTPAPAPSQQVRSGNPLALVLLALVALAGIAVGALTATGAFTHDASTRTITSSTTNGVTGRSQATRPDNHHDSKTSCGGDLSVGPDTSCPFARNVEQAYDNAGGGETDVTAYSPTTGLTYVMHCTGGTPHACSGGKGASVYFTSGPAPNRPSPPVPSSGADLHACDPNISANEVATCPFAENLFVAYWTDWKENGPQEETTVSAYSPQAHLGYPMTCTTEGVTVNCSGANEAFVTFPMHAVEVYEAR